jgi:hypothetical protein
LPNGLQAAMFIIGFYFQRKPINIVKYVQFIVVLSQAANVIKLRDKSQKDVTLSAVEGHLFVFY